MNASVSRVRFIDLDLDMSQLGGNISWEAPADSSRVQVPHNLLLPTHSQLQWSPWSVLAAGLCCEFVPRPERPYTIQFGLPIW